MGSGDILRCKEIYQRFIRLESQMSDWVRGIEKKRIIVFKTVMLELKTKRGKSIRFKILLLKVTKDQIHACNGQ